MADHDNYHLDPAWLRLPHSRRLQATRRLRAVLDYEAIQSPGVEDAKRCAGKAGVSVRLFYMLLKRWRTPGGRSIWSFTPYQQTHAAGRAQLAPDVTIVLHDLIQAAVAEGKRLEREILKSVVAQWPAGLQSPSHQTMRLHIQGASGMDLIEKGFFRLNNSFAPQEKAEIARKHGEVLVLDHCAPDVFVDADPPRRPTLTLAIDLYTATIAGFALSGNSPSANMVLAALGDAEARCSEYPGEPVTPRIVVAATNGRPWRDLFNELAVRKLHATVRWGSRLHFGGPTKRLIGARIGDVTVWSRKAHDPSGGAAHFDPSRDTLLSASDAHLVISDAVIKLNTRRLSEGAVLHRIKLEG